MRLKYLGTAAAEGWPALFCECEACKKAALLGGKNIRTRAGSLIDEGLLIDLSPDIYLQKLTQGLNLARVKTLIVTHNHSDHYCPAILESYAYPFAIREDTSPLEVYVSAPGFAQYHEMVREMNMRVLQNEDNVVLHEIRAFQPFDAGGYRIHPLAASHGAEASLIYAIERGGRRLLYANDTGLFPGETWDYLAAYVRDSGPFTLVSMDCTNGPNSSSYFGHMGFEQNAALRERMLKDGLAAADAVFIANHFSHCAGRGLTHEDMERALRAYNIIPSYDGMEMEVRLCL